MTIEGFVGEDIKQTIYIQSMDDIPLEVNEIKTNLDEFISYSIKSESRNHKYALTLANKRDTAKSFMGYIKLITNHPLKNEISLDINGRIKSIIDYWPKEIVFKKSKDTDVMGHQLLTIVNIQNNDLKLKEIKFNRKLFNVVLLQTKNNLKSTQQIEIKPVLKMFPSNTQKIEDFLFIKTDGRHVEEIKIPMTLLFGADEK